MRALSVQEFVPNEVNVEQIVPQGWCYLRHDPYGFGLSLNGELRAEIEIAANCATVLVGQILPAEEQIDPYGKPVARTRQKRWVNVILRQYPSTSANSTVNLSTIELQGVNAERPNDPKIGRSPLIPMELSSVFRLHCRFRLGRLHADLFGSEQRLTSLELTSFGECLPVLKLRQGPQAAISGIFRANARLLRN